MHFYPYKPSILSRWTWANNALYYPDQTSDQGLHFLLTESSIKILIKMKNTMKQKLTGLTDKSGKFHSAYIG